MTSKKRLLDALNHRESDRIPVDFGGTICSCMHITCVAALREYYGLEKHPVKLYEPFQMLGLIEDAHNAGGALSGAGLPIHKHHAMMYLGNTLFLFEPMGAVKNLRDVEFGIGIAPLPKYEEAQENYLTYIFHSANAIAIPITNPDAERTGVILEHMGAYSHETVRDVFFNTTLDFKYAQDQEGQEMLDIMFAGGTFELGIVYGWGGIAWELIGQVKEGKTEIASKVAALETKAETAIQTTIDTFTELKG